MKYLPRLSAALFALGIIALSASPAPAVQPAWHRHGGGQNLTGQYSGSVSDSSLGTGTAVGNFAGLFGTLGGYFGFTFGSATYTNAASTVASWDGLSGVFVATIGSSACTFAFQASYTTSNNQLNGKYKAINGCSGENGKFSLTQQCYYDEQWQQAHKNNGLEHC
jgi:Spy/CpxP family protein refolding chaperone